MGIMKKTSVARKSNLLMIYFDKMWKWLNKSISTDLFFAKIGEKVNTVLFVIMRFLYQQFQHIKNSKIKDFRNPKVYKLRGYTTTSRIDKKVRKEQNQRLLRNILVAAVIALVLAIFILLFNPFKDLREIFRIIGI
jgi:hypothetical protein